MKLFWRYWYGAKRRWLLVSCLILVSTVCIFFSVINNFNNEFKTVLASIRYHYIDSGMGEDSYVIRSDRLTPKWHFVGSKENINVASVSLINNGKSEINIESLVRFNSPLDQTSAIVKSLPKFNYYDFFTSGNKIKSPRVNKEIIYDLPIGRNARIVISDISKLDPVNLMGYTFVSDVSEERAKQLVGNFFSLIVEKKNISSKNESIKHRSSNLIVTIANDSSQSLFKSDDQPFLHNDVFRKVLYKQSIDSLSTSLLHVGLDDDTATLLGVRLASKLVDKYISNFNLLIRYYRFKRGGQNVIRPITLSVMDSSNRDSITFFVLDNGELKQSNKAFDDRLPVLDYSSVKSKETLFQSLHILGLKEGLDKELINILVGLFIDRINFNDYVTDGASITILYEPKEKIKSSDGHRIIYAKITNNGKTYELFRFVQNGEVSYLDKSGKGARKLLNVRVVPAGHLTSRFGMRFHPILKKKKMHYGIDWGAKWGSKILAAGNGTVLRAGWYRGYGRYILIDHGGGYMTAYAHLSKINQGIKLGSSVYKGQFIARVGSTGLSTGPHLHFEVHLNKKRVNPLKVFIPFSGNLDKSYKSKFNKFIEQTKALTKPKQVWLNQ